MSSLLTATACSYLTTYQPISRLSNIRQDLREVAEQVLSEYIGGLAKGEAVQDRAKAWLQKKNYIWPGDATVCYPFSFLYHH